MQLKFHYTKQEVIKALRYHFLHRGEVRVFKYALIILLAFSIIGFSIHIVSLPATVAIMLMIAIICSVFWYLLPLSIYNKAATFKETIEVNFQDEGIIIGTQSGRRLASWKSFDNVVETAGFFFLYRNKKSFFLIPTNAFANDKEKQSFTRMLKDKQLNYHIE